MFVTSYVHFTTVNGNLSIATPAARGADVVGWRATGVYAAGDVYDGEVGTVEFGRASRSGGTLGTERNVDEPADLSSNTIMRTNATLSSKEVIESFYLHQGIDVVRWYPPGRRPRLEPSSADALYFEWDMTGNTVMGGGSVYVFFEEW